MSALGVLLLLGLSGAAPFDVALFVPAEMPALEPAVAAQLSGLEVGLVRRPEPGWPPGEAAQLRAVRALLVGTRVRVAVWLEREPRQLHVADLWTGRHLLRPLARDGSEAEAAGLIVRGAVQAFLAEEEVAPPPPAEPEPAGPPPPLRVWVAALWQVGAWADGLPLAQAPRLDVRLSGPRSGWGARVSGRWELPVTYASPEVSLGLQRAELAVAGEYALRFGRVELTPAVGVAARLVRVTPVAHAEGLQAAAPATDVGWAAAAALHASVRLAGPLWGVASGGVQVPLRTVRYRLEGAAAPVVVLQGRAVEPSGALGLAVELPW